LQNNCRPNPKISGVKSEASRSQGGVSRQGIVDSELL